MSGRIIDYRLMSNHQERKWLPVIDEYVRTFESLHPEVAKAVVRESGQLLEREEWTDFIRLTNTLRRL